MEKIGFIGAYDKTDIIIYMAKILAVLGKRVLVVDSTVNQKAKYVVPVINPTKAYVTQYENFDVSVGFKNFDDIASYLGVERVGNLYDVALLDIDESKTFNDFEMRSATKNYFVTSFDLFSLKKGLEVLTGLEETLKMTKVLFSKNADEEENEYLNFLSLNYKVMWDDEIIYFPIDRGDLSAIIENQRLSSIKFKNFTEEFMAGFSILAQEIAGIGLNELNKVFKIIEKG